MLLILFSISLCFSWVSPATDSIIAVYTAVSGMTDFPEVTKVATVNGIQVNYHDSNIRQTIPRQQFLMESFKQAYWDDLSSIGNRHSTVTKDYLFTVMKSMNQTSGIHTFQLIMIVEVTEDGSIKRSMRFGFDGKDYISLEPDRMRWVATNHFAVKTKEKWDLNESWNKHWKRTLEVHCVQYLKRYLQAGKEHFERKVQPDVFISRSEPNSQYKSLTLSCLVTGFYPADIEVTWLRNGEVMSETLSSGVRPNHDGTHQIQKEIEINAGDEDQYSCQIEHSSLAEPKLHQSEILGNSEGRSHLGIIIGSVIPALAVIFGIIIWKRQRRDTNTHTVMYTVVSGIEDFPAVTGTGVVNGVQTGYCDSNIRRCIPRQRFMAENIDTKFWDYISELVNSHSDMVKENLNTVLKITNQTSGIHVLQLIRSVEVTEDGSMKRSMRFGFDGKDYISLEPDRMRWVASNHFAVKTKEKWDSDQSWNNYWEKYLQEVLVQDLNKYLEAGKEYFGRKVQPEVFISRSEPISQYKSLTLYCLVTGFYPVDIEVNWLRNGEVMSETLSSGVRPNHDGTHQIQKEIEINAGDEDQYSCQIEHSSLAEPKLHQSDSPSGTYTTAPSQ
ncbi:DLA class I histocompatibility antigen, A9/A9 alpha chain-like isoform X2 [Mustelus asterias]